MEKTNAYKLSQWEKNDRILMEDFNSDNASIEQALTALETKKADLTLLNSTKSTLQKEDQRLNTVKLEHKTIKTYTFTANNTTTHTLDLGTLPLWNYFFVRLHVEVPQGALVQMYLGNPSGCKLTPLGDTSGTLTCGMLGSGTSGDFIFWPMKCKAAQVVASRMNLFCELHHGDATYENFKKIVFTPWKTQTNFSGTFTLTFTGIQ